jgi:hypothetical protein
MARIPSTTFKDWKDGDIVNAEEYERELEIIRAAVNDNHDRITTLQSVSGGSISRIPHGTAFPTSDIQPGQIFFRSDQELLYLLGTDMQWEPFAPKSTLDAHTLNDDNPHNVSASQVGAYDKAEADIKFVGKHKSTGGAGVLYNAVMAIYGTAGNTNTLSLTVRDTVTPSNYWTGIAHYKHGSYITLTKLAGNNLTLVENNLGTVSVTGGGSGSYDYHVVGLAG